jgi:accessory gene regulator B
MLAYIRHLFSSEELSAFDYGILCILLDTLDFLPVIILSFLLNHNVWIGAIFIVELSLLRQYSGGWHAKSIPLCIVCYSVVFCIFEYCLSFSIDLVFLFCLCLVSFLYIIIYSPVMISNSDYCNDLIVQNKKRSVISYIIILGISLILVQFSLPYAKASMLVLLINTCLMFQLQIVNYWKGRLNDDYSSNHY